MRVKLQSSEEAKKELLIMFNSSNWNEGPINTAFVGLSIIGIDGQQYGSYSIIRREELQGRHYIVERWDKRPHIVLLDTIFDHTKPYAFAYHKLDMPSLLRRRRYKRYKLGKLSYLGIYGWDKNLRKGNKNGKKRSFGISS